MTFRRSLKLQLALGATVLGLVIVVMLSVLQFELMRQTVTKEVQDDQTDTVTEMARLLDEKLDERVLALRAVAKSIAQPLSSDLHVLEGHLSSQAALLTLYDDLYIFDAQGVLLVDWPVKPGRRTLDMSSRDYIQGIRGGLDAYISKPILGKATQQPIVVVAVPIQDSNGALKGILGGVLNLYKPNLLGSLPHRKNGETGYFYLVGPDRTVIAHPDKALILKPAAEVGTNISLDQALQGYEGSLLTAPGTPQERLETFHKMQNNGWVLAAVLPTSEAFEPIRSIRNRMALLTALMLVMMIPLLWVFAKRLLMPLSDLANAMQTSAQRMLPGVPAEAVPVQGASEIRTVANAFNDFLEARNEAETLLTASEQRASLLIDHVSDGIWDWDVPWGQIALNPAMRAMLGLVDTESVSAQDMDRQFHPDDVMELSNARDVCLRGDANEFSCEHRMRTCEGRWIWVQTSGVVVSRDERGFALRMLGTVVNISSRREQLETLAAAKASAEAASAAKSNFLANMSHEIRTPMNGVMGMTQLCLETELTPQQRGYLEMVDSSARSLLAVIDDILDFSKIEAHKLELALQPFCLQDLLVGTCRTLSLKAAEKGLSLVLDAAPDIPNTLVGDAGRLQQVLTNLIGNAIKFTPTGHVAVRAELRPGDASAIGHTRLMFSVSDTGIGIANDKLALVFDAFTQADATTTRQFGGTGLGLSISRSLVRLMEGDIHVTSEQGTGSCFTFEVVLGLPAQSLTNVPKPPPESLCVVVCMADAAQRSSVVAALRRSGTTVLEATPQSLRAVSPPHGVLPVGMVLDADAHWPTVSDELPWGAHVAVVRVGNLLAHAANQRADHVANRFLLLPLDHRELSVWVASLTVPNALPNSQAQTATPVAPPIKPSSKRSLQVLVAEDNVVNQKLISALLTRMGHQVDLATNGVEAVARFRNGAWDVVLMDIQMPEMGGLEATSQIREIERSQNRISATPIIALTANALKGDREAYLAAGMDGYVSKPISVGALQAELDRLTTLQPQG